jgi:hypothetical protein
MKFRGNSRRKPGPREGQRRYGALPGESDILTIMQRLRAAGEPYEHIAAHLNGRHIPTRMACRWRASTISKILRARA